MGVAWRRGVDFAGCKACTARRRGRSFCAYKRNQNTVKGDRFPLDKPLSGRPAALDTNLFLGYRPKTNPYCTQMGFKGVCDTFLSPLRWSAERRTTTPVPSSEEGNYGAGKQILSNLRLARCKAADPWLWLAGLAACSKREGVPLPRSGGGWEGANTPAAPYKHRLAHAPGRRSRSGRAFRCVGVLGFTPSRFWALLASQKCHPGGSRANHAF